MGIQGDTRTVGIAFQCRFLYRGRRLLEPKPHIRHLYERRVDKFDQKRADQIVAAWEKYAAERDAISEEPQVFEIEERAVDQWEEVSEQLKLIAVMHVNSLTGLRVKLDLLASIEGCDQDFKNSKKELLASIVRDFGSRAAA